MKVLWIVNMLFPEAANLLSLPKENSGGWMTALLEKIAELDGIELAVATVSPVVKRMTTLKGRAITYYIIPYGKGNLKKNDEYRPIWKDIADEFNPDVVHIHGTEYSHGLSYIQELGNSNVVISIQGLTSVYMYYTYGLSTWEILSNITPRDILKGTMFRSKRLFRKRGDVEIKMLQGVKNIIGRTSWDRAHTLAINPNAMYYKVNEVLRKEFYTGCWTFDKCSKNTLFISQCGYSLKGLHQLLKALPLVVQEIPELQVRIPGFDVTRSGGFRDKMKLTGYGKIIQGLIQKGGLKDHIVFLGPLTAEKMKEEYLSANLFVCPSAIENSPNSLAEAQILGVPCVASYVGGIPDMIPTKECGLMYRFEEVEMLAYDIIETLRNSKYFNNVNERQMALKRHNEETIINDLLSVYNVIKNEK